MMSNQELHRYTWENALSVNAEKRVGAARVLRDNLPIDDLTQRIAKDRYGWLHKAEVPCGCSPRNDNCRWCKGSGTVVMSMHHGWGTAVRNLLRTEGFGEKELEIDNLDDYYAAFVEMACGYTEPG